MLSMVFRELHAYRRAAEAICEHCRLHGVPLYPTEWFYDATGASWKDEFIHVFYLPPKDNLVERCKAWKIWKIAAEVAANAS